MDKETCERILKQIEQHARPLLLQAVSEPSIEELGETHASRALKLLKRDGNCWNADKGISLTIVDYVFYKTIENNIKRFFTLNEDDNDACKIYFDKVEETDQFKKAHLSELMSYDLCRKSIEDTDKIFTAIKNDGLLLYQYSCFLYFLFFCKDDNSDYDRLIEKIMPEEYWEYTKNIIGLIAHDAVPYILPLLKIDLVSQQKSNKMRYSYNRFYFLEHFQLPKGILCYNKINKAIYLNRKKRFDVLKTGDLESRKRSFLLSSFNNSFDGENEFLQITKEIYRYYKNFNVECSPSENEDGSDQFDLTGYKKTQKDIKPYLYANFLQTMAKIYYITAETKAVQNHHYNTDLFQDYFDTIDTIVRKNSAFKFFSLYALNSITRCADVCMNREELGDCSSIFGLATKLELENQSMYISAKDAYIINKVIEGNVDLQYSHKGFKRLEVFETPAVFGDIYSKIQLRINKNKITLSDVFPLLRSSLQRLRISERRYSKQDTTYKIKQI